MIKYFFFISIFFALVSMGGSQSLPDNISNGEIQLSAIESQIQKLQDEKRALQKQLVSRLHQADSLKVSGVSENSQAKFTAGSFQISQRLESLNRQLKDLGIQQNYLRANLYKLYSHQVDSLSGLTKSIQIDKKLFALMSKRLQVSPLAGNLHFNPQQLSAIDESESDSLAQIIFAQYLQNANSELEKEIAALQNKEQEIEELAALESKAEEFMQEMEESGMLKTVPGSDVKSTESVGLDYGEKDISARNLVTANEQAVGFFHLLNQWQTNPEQISVDSQPLTYSQLLQKLSQTRQLLESYRRQILNKLERLSDR